MPEYEASSAEFSADGLHRFELRRQWGEGGTVAFIGLNPSTAGADEDDPTIRRCVRFARDWGYGGLLMVNLFSLIATDPKALVGREDRNRLASRRHLLGAADCDLVVGAWGASLPQPIRGWWLEQQGIPNDYRVLGVTKNGHPRHPLYLRAACVPLDRRTLAPVAIPAATPEGGETDGE